MLGDVFKVVFFKTGYSAEWDNRTLVNTRGNTEKLDNNLSRAKARIKELTLCNDWSHFVTLTLNENKVVNDRYNLEDYIKKLGYWISDYNKKYNANLKYILIPEQHQNGAWHMHGLMNGIAPESLRKNKNGYWEIGYYADRFGWFSCSPVKNKKKISTYITKYIVKALQATAIGLCKHSFYHSQGLKGAEDIHEGVCSGIPENVWSNDFVGVHWLENYGDLKKFVEGLEEHENN